MDGNYSNEIPRIRPEMTVLEVVRTYKQTEEIFKKYDTQIGACIMCTALFESLQQVSERFGLNLKNLLKDLEAVAQ